MGVRNVRIPSRYNDRGEETREVSAEEKTRGEAMHWLSGAWIRLLSIAWQGFPLAALISLQTLRDALNTLGYPAVTIFVMIESSGIPFPGETMLLLASFYA